MPNERVLSVPWREFKEKLYLSPELSLFLETTRRFAESEGLFLYIAGGPVRDFLLRREVKDLDLVLEGDWERILEKILEVTGAKLLMKSQFLTFKVRVGAITIDLATSRKEYYSEPAVLPQVYPAGFEEDIRRRDFTINALVYGLTGPYRERIIDLVGGIYDLDKGLIRPLHEKSFVDDPTRILRGIRYKVRFSFNYTEEFFRALESAKRIDSPLKLSPSRLSQELLNFIKKEPFQLLYVGVKELKRNEILKLFGLKDRNFIERDIEVLLNAKQELSEREFHKFFLLSLVELRMENLERLGFGEEERKLIERHMQRLKDVVSNEPDIFRMVELLEKIPLYLLYRLCLEDNYREIVERYLNEWRKIRPSLGGKELKSLGLDEGRKIGEILREIRRMKLLGKIRTYDEELNYAKSLIFSKN